MRAITFYPNMRRAAASRHGSAGWYNSLHASVRDKGGAMLTNEKLIEYLEKVIAEDVLSGNRLGLKNSQRAAGFLMSAADYAGDKELARRFRALAAQAANKDEQLGKND
jgi:hypothetical protein